ncbi:MAG: hypothetical protein JNJ54_21425 [Myxococcaceae bacterium]|nr:hypothetical protein [Myxococcaceae bacterium]
MRTTASALVVILVSMSSARAAEVTIRISSEITFQGLSELTSTSTDATSSERHAGPPPLKQGKDGAACRTHDDCRNWCQGGVCANSEPPPAGCHDSTQCAAGLVCWNGQCATPQQPACTSNQECAQGLVCWSGQCAQPQQPACTSDAQCAQGSVCWSGQCVQSAQPQPTPTCSSNQHCAPGFVCWGGQCVQSAQPPPPPPPPSSGCSSNAQCAPGFVCVNGACASPPTLRRGTELFLRQRVVQLRQELSFGEGPVITALASFHHLSAVELGRLLRRHRAELTALMGDGDDAWAGRFLRRVEELEATCQG